MKEVMSDCISRGHCSFLWRAFSKVWPLLQENLLRSIDGAIHVGYGIATAGGVLLNRKGEWIMGYNSLLGECSMFDIELWGIFDGLTLIQDNQFAKVMIQTDCLEAIKTIQATSFNDSNSTRIRRIYHCLANIGVWGMQVHVQGV
ncbi:hypothetical protein Gotri_005073 [Gossypium trilobum]|uniref:RNase H type-1 domain-containing protein n=1 Tax=Gossypium trilobum TaxID=34281 RepID=A0A7J9EVC5_9ROSI|nr:hypothetical protein [Gossypium trilobum]